MFDDDIVTTDEMFATGATFTVLAWAFAYLFVAVQIVWPGSFTAAVDADDPRTWVELLFLSVTTLSSTGLSDVVPITPHGRSVVMIEQHHRDALSGTGGRPGDRADHRPPPMTERPTDLTAGRPGRARPGWPAARAWAGPGRCSRTARCGRG